MGPPFFSLTTREVIRDRRAASGNSTRLLTNLLAVSPLGFNASSPKQKHSRAKFRIIHFPYKQWDVGIPAETLLPAADQNKCKPKHQSPFVQVTIWTVQQLLQHTETHFYNESCSRQFLVDQETTVQGI